MTAALWELCECNRTFSSPGGEKSSSGYTHEDLARGQEF